MWVPRLLTFGPALLAVAAGWWLWQGWRQQSWQPEVEGVRLGVQRIGTLDEALQDPGLAWLWRDLVGRSLIRLDGEGRLRPDLVTGWRSYQTTRVFFRQPDDAGVAEERLRELGVDRWVAWGLADVEVEADELRIRFDRPNEEAAAEAVDLMDDLSVMSLARVRVAATDHAEQLAREFIEEGTELASVKALWLDGFEAFELIVAGGSERVERELETRLAARTRLQPSLEVTAHGRWMDEVVLEFDLDPAARWHDGRPFTGRDVVELTDRWRAGLGVVAGTGARIGRGADPAMAAGEGARRRDWPGFDLFRRIMAWELVGDHRVALRLWQPQGSLLAPWTEVPVLRRFDPGDGDGAESGSAGSARLARVLGCGPVELVEWRPGARAVWRLAEQDGGLVEWIEAGGPPRRERLAELGMLHGFETRAAEARPLAAPAESPLHGWRELESGCRADWWLIWAAGPSGGADGGAAVEVRRWLMRQWDGDAGGLSAAGWVAWQPGWNGGRADEGTGLGGEVSPEDAPAALEGSVLVRLGLAGDDERGEELRTALAEVWRAEGVTVERAGSGDGGAGSTPGAGDGLELEGWLVRLRPGDPTAVLGWWHGPARADGGDARMDELLRQFGEGLEGPGAAQRAKAIDLRVERLGWGRPLAREVGWMRMDPAWDDGLMEPGRDGTEAGAGLLPWPTEGTMGEGLSATTGLRQGAATVPRRAGPGR